MHLELTNQRSEIEQIMLTKHPNPCLTAPNQAHCHQAHNCSDQSEDLELGTEINHVTQAGMFHHKRLLLGSEASTLAQPSPATAKPGCL